MRRALLLLLLLVLPACGGSGDPAAPPTLPSLPPISLPPVGPADLSPPPSVARLLGAYTGDACGPVSSDVVRDLTGVPGTVEFAVRAGTTLPPNPEPAASTSCLYAAIASSVGLSLPGPARPPAAATYAGQVRDALPCQDRATRAITVLGLPGTLIDCPSQHSRVLALRGRAFAPGVVSSPTCAVLNAMQVDENRFLAFCADALRRAAT